MLVVIFRSNKATRYVGPFRSPGDTSDFIKRIRGQSVKTPQDKAILRFTFYTVVPLTSPVDTETRSFQLLLPE